MTYLSFTYLLLIFYLSQTYLKNRRKMDTFLKSDVPTPLSRSEVGRTKGSCIGAPYLEPKNGFQRRGRAAMTSARHVCRREPDLRRGRLRTGGVSHWDTGVYAQCRYCYANGCITHWDTHVCAGVERRRANLANEENNLCSGAPKERRPLAGVTRLAAPVIAIDDFVVDEELVASGGNL